MTALSALSKEDPQGSARLRLELAERSLAEAEEYVRKGDAVQASGKEYMAAEEVVKALAERLDVPKHGQAVNEGRWYAHLLASVATKPSSGLGRWVAEGWGACYNLHRWGLHEVKLSVDDVAVYIENAKAMAEEASRSLLGS